jgi:hypothetical protein
MGVVAARCPAISFGLSGDRPLEAVRQITAPSQPLRIGPARECGRLRAAELSGRDHLHRLGDLLGRL